MIGDGWRIIIDDAEVSTSKKPFEGHGRVTRISKLNIEIEGGNSAGGGSSAATDGHGLRLGWLRREFWQ